MNGKRKREWREGQRKSNEILREAQYMSMELNEILRRFLHSGKQQGGSRTWIPNQG